MRLTRRVIAVERLHEIPARCFERAQRILQSGLRGECFTMTARFASTAGMMTFTAVSSG